MNDNERRIALLSKTNWSVDDLIEFENVGRTKAYDLRRLAISNGCGIKYNPRMINVQKYLQLTGTTREQEITVLKVAQVDPEKLIEVNIRG
jgi:hypothetical protein